MSKTLRVTLDEGVSAVATLEASVTAPGPLMVVGAGMYGQLVHELGSPADVFAFLLALADRSGQPLAVNAPTPTGSRTAFIAPTGWTEPRLTGWVAGQHEELAALFGPGTLATREAL